MTTEQVSLTEARTFFDALSADLTDPRDNRGKRHNLAFIICGVTLAIMAGRSKTSSIHRYIEHKIAWLREITGHTEAKPISRAHLPRLLARADWTELNKLSEDHLGLHIERTESDEWHTVDGKTLRGTTHADDKQGERIVTAVGQTSRQTVGHEGFGGSKGEERAAVQELLEETGLEKKRVSLDALHMIPKTTTQINQAGGKFIIQVKKNQKKLCAALESTAEQDDPLGVWVSANKGHGRIEVRKATLFDVSTAPFADRWQESDFQTFILMERQRTEVVKQKTSTQISYYISNEPVNKENDQEQKIVVEAIRGHWGVESENWIRDVTFGEDGVKTKDGQQAQVMASLRTLSIRLFRKANFKNFQATLERFTDCPDQFENFLHRFGFL